MVGTALGPAQPDVAHPGLSHGGVFGQGHWQRLTSVSRSPLQPPGQERDQVVVRIKGVYVVISCSSKPSWGASPPRLCSVSPPPWAPARVNPFYPTRAVEPCTCGSVWIVGVLHYGTSVGPSLVLPSLGLGAARCSLWSHAWSGGEMLAKLKVRPGYHALLTSNQPVRRQTSK